MPFPLSTRVIFDRNPLAEVICQLRFPPILRIIAEPPADFQDRIRAEYPIFEQVSPNPGAQLLASGVQVEGGGFNIGWQQPSYSFTTESGERTVTLTQESISVAERRYQRWEALSHEIETVKTELEAVYGPAFYHRIGLRYQNIISRANLGLSDVPWAELLNPVFAGLLSSDKTLSDQVRQLTSIAEIDIPETPDGKVHLRHGLLEAQDAQPHIFAIDSDFFTTQRSEPANVKQVLDAFHLHAGNLFRWAIAERLRTALGPTELEPTSQD